MSSLHCIGMCGPILMLTLSTGHPMHPLKHVLQYQLGRTVVYIMLGLLFGLFGTIFTLPGLQGSISILLGSFLIIVAVMSLDLDTIFARNRKYRNVYAKYSQYISRILKAGSYHPLLIGALNGLLPCGVVYIALVGALATSHILSGSAFMLFFGLGTWPVFILLGLGNTTFPKKLKRRFGGIMPIVQLGMGIFLIIRALYIDMPTNWEFWAGLADPTMCHTK